MACATSDCTPACPPAHVSGACLPQLPRGASLPPTGITPAWVGLPTDRSPDIAQVQGPKLFMDRGHPDDAGGRGGLEVTQQQVGQVEVPHVVAGHRLLKAVLAPVGGTKRPCVGRPAVPACMLPGVPGGGSGNQARCQPRQQSTAAHCQSTASSAAGQAAGRCRPQHGAGGQPVMPAS